LRDHQTSVPSDFENRATGLQRKARTVLFVTAAGRFAGLLAVADPIKQSAPAAVKELEQLGIQILMLTGDNEHTAKAVADQLGSTRDEYGVHTQDKYQRVKAHRSANQVVSMAGDGINDAPALAAANVG